MAFAGRFTRSCDDPPESARVVREEAFGPVLPRLKFNDIDDVIARANDTEYGLAAPVWSKDIAQAKAIAERIEAGTVWVNEIHSFPRLSLSAITSSRASASRMVSTVWPKMPMRRRSR